MKTISTGKAFNELDSKELGKWGERVAIKYIEKIGLTVVRFISIFMINTTLWIR